METSEQSTDDDMAVISAVLGGDIDAFGILVEKYQGKMLTISYRMLGDREEACEAVQDAFISAYRSLGTFKGKAQFSTWLCSIVLNCTRSRMRRIVSSGTRDSLPIGGVVEREDGAVMIDIASGDPSPAERLERKEVRMGVERCLGGLPENFREAVVLRDVNGFSYDEMSRIMGVSMGTVKSRVSRGRDMVRECLKRLLGGAL